MNTSRLGTLGLTALLPLTLLGATLLNPHQPTNSNVEVPSIPSRPSEVTLTCLDAMINPFGNDDGLPAAHVNIHHLESSAASHTQLLSGTHLADTYITPIIQSGGELRGVSLIPCQSPSREHWFAFGDTTPGEDTLIRLTNPTHTPITLTVTAWGRQGQIAEADHTLIIAADDTLTLRPGTFLPNEPHPVIKITAESGAIGAWMLSSGMSGEVPQGATWYSSTSANTRHVITGITTDQSTVRLINTEAQDTTINLSWISNQDAQPLPGGTLDMAAHSVVEIPLPHMGNDYAALLVESSQTRVSAHVTMKIPGKKWAQGNTYWADRHISAPAQRQNAINLPTYEELETLTTRFARTQILRPTPLATPSGLTLTSAHLVVTNTNNEVSTLTSPDHSVSLSVDAHRSATFDLKEYAPTGNEPLKLTANHSLYAVIALEYTTPTGQVHATVPLHTLSLDAQNVPLTVLNR